MTVAQLLERLSAYPADMPVLVEGYDVGYDDARLEAGYIRPLDYDPGIIGRYEWVDADERGAQQALILERDRRRPG